MSRHARAVVVGATVVVVVVLAAVALALSRAGGSGVPEAEQHASARGPLPTSASDWVFERASDPDRTLVRDRAGNLLATFTDTARTVAIAGPSRTFSEPKYTSATVTLNVWVRLAPQEWHAGAERDGWFAAWFARELTDTSADAIGVAFQYVYGAPALYDAQGVRYAGDAAFGPHSSSDPDGRAENNDFYDYLGISYSFPDAKNVRPQKDRYGDVDCSGFIRLVYGYRLGYPMRKANTPGPGLPRRAVGLSEFGPGAEVVMNEGVPARGYDVLQPGDLVFFDLDPSDGPAVDHSGIFLGTDDSGHYRFISSRTLANGPTMGDAKYAAVLDGSGHFAVGFRTARRI